MEFGVPEMTELELAGETLLIPVPDTDDFLGMGMALAAGGRLREALVVSTAGFCE